MERMEDLPLKAAPTKKTRRNRSATTKKRKTVKYARTVKNTAKRPVKSLPPIKMSGEQPRDNLGRFARKAGILLWSGAKTTGRAIKGTAKTFEKVYRTVKRVNANARRRARIEIGEREIAIRERAARLRPKRRKRVTAKRQRKQGFISRLLFGKRKRT